MAGFGLIGGVGFHTKSIGPSTHALQDVEEYDFIEFTIVVKLTPSAPGEPPSAMRVVGAPRHFRYGAEAGASGCFRARLHHASLPPPPAACEHLKIACFFRTCPKGERRAKRGLAAEGDVCEQSLAARRRQVTHELNGYTFEAQYLSSLRSAV